MILFIKSNNSCSSNYIINQKQTFNKYLIKNINKNMAVVVYWLITAGCGPAKGSSINLFGKNALPKNYENLPDRPLFLRGET